MSASGPRTLDLRGAPFEGEAVAEVVDHLAGGGVIGYPTETVYGFGAATDPAGVAAVARLKGRDPAKPFLVLLPDAAAGAPLAWTDPARELAEIFWPGILRSVLL